MRKSLLLILIGGLFLFSGCGKMNESDVIKTFEKTVKDAKSYNVSGTLEIVNNEDVYTYDVEASYAKDDKYKVNLVNTVNSHQQIILRNQDGVYV